MRRFCAGLTGLLLLACSGTVGLAQPVTLAEDDLDRLTAGSVADILGQLSGVQIGPLKRIRLLRQLREELRHLDDEFWRSGLAGEGALVVEVSTRNGRVSRQVTVPGGTVGASARALPGTAAIKIVVAPNGGIAVIATASNK